VDFRDISQIICPTLCSLLLPTSGKVDCLSLVDL